MCENLECFVPRKFLHSYTVVQYSVVRYWILAVGIFPVR